MHYISKITKDEGWSNNQKNYQSKSFVFQPYYLRLNLILVYETNYPNSIFNLYIEISQIHSIE